PWLWMGSAAAAVILFGVVGAGASHLIGELPFPGLVGPGSRPLARAVLHEKDIAGPLRSDTYAVSQSVEQLAREDSEKTLARLDSLKVEDTTSSMADMGAEKSGHYLQYAPTALAPTTGIG